MPNTPNAPDPVPLQFAVPSDLVLTVLSQMAGTDKALEYAIKAAKLDVALTLQSQAPQGLQGPPATGPSEQAMGPFGNPDSSQHPTQVPGPNHG